MYRHLSCLRVALLLLLVSACGAATAHAAAPNVILILSDDQRFDTIRALGNSEIQTPHLDRLVERGFTFRTTYIHGGTQPAVCVTSRACLMSGRPSWRAPSNLNGVKTLPEVLSAAGVHTYGIGKWHNGPASYARGFQDGAAIFFGGMHDHRGVPVFAFNPDGKYPKSAQQTSDVFSSELFAGAAIDFLKAYRSEKPFFLYVALTAPHDPRTPPDEFRALYDPERLSLPENFLAEHPFDNGELQIRDEKLAPWPRTPEVIRQHLADYYGMISHLDAQVGRILEALEASPHAKQTIVVFASDNGLAVGQHGLLGKQSMYEHSLRVPLVLAGPGIPAGKSSDVPVYLHDLFPTICRWQEAKAPSGIEARDLQPLISGQTDTGREAIYATYRDVQRMVRVGDHKLIYYPKIDRTQLFDLARDPHERHDLAADPQHASVVERLRRQLATLQEELGDKPAQASNQP